MHLSPTETAQRFGVSIKALRLYESRGLLKPLRTEAGRRTYGPDQIARLHQILALKRMGLTLARIAELLAGADRLDAVLAIQEQVLSRDSQRLARALALVKSARATLAAGKPLSIDDLATLSQETVMTYKPDAEEMAALSARYTQKHLSPEDLDRLKQYADPDTIAEWQAVIAEAKAVMAAGDPASPAALDVARRWRNVVSRLSGGDAALAARARGAWKDALADPRFAAGSPLTAEVVDFMAQAKAHLDD